MTERTKKLDGLLDRLFPTVGAERFMREYYAKKPLVVTGPVDRFALNDDAALFAVGRLLETGPKDVVNAYLRPAGKSFHFRIQAESAKSFYNAGGTVEISGVLETFPTIRRLGDALKRDLGARYMHAVVLASPGGDALPMHFDQQDVFIFHLAGRKRWLIAENTSVTDPVDSYFPGTDGVGRDAAIWPEYFPWKMPATMPADAIDVVLEAGSVAYVPRGWWHQTIAPESSVSVTIICTPPNFTNLLLEKLGKQLAKDADMRRAMPLPIDQERRAQTRNEAAALLVRATEILASISPDDLISIPFAKRRFVRVANAELDLGANGNSQHVAKVSSEGNLVAQIEVDSALLPLCAWLATQHDFTGATARTATEIDDEEIVEASVATFVEAGFLAESR